MGHEELAQIEAEIEQLALPKQFLLIERIARRLREEVIVSPYLLDDLEWIARMMKERAHQCRDPLDDDLDAMAADPDIQRELRLIEAEFAVTEMDGLGEIE